jgi:CspA family cold shock protein
VNGTVKRWLGDRGFGFITADGGGHEVFVHVSALGGLVELREGQRVTFEEEPDPRGAGRVRAAKVVVL